MGDLRVYVLRDKHAVCIITHVLRSTSCNHWYLPDILSSEVMKLFARYPQEMALCPYNISVA